MTTHLDALDGAELGAHLQDLERLARSSEQAIVTVLGEVDRRVVWAEDGHRSVRGWCMATANWSWSETTARLRTATLLEDLAACRRSSHVRSRHRHRGRSRAGERNGPVDGARADRRRCETLDGALLDPFDVVAAAVLGHIRHHHLDFPPLTRTWAPPSTLVKCASEGARPPWVFALATWRHTFEADSQIRVWDRMP